MVNCAQNYSEPVQFKSVGSDREEIPRHRIPIENASRNNRHYIPREGVLKNTHTLHPLRDCLDLFIYGGALCFSIGAHNSGLKVGFMLIFSPPPPQE
jgi:hypothetical protein